MKLICKRHVGLLAIVFTFSFLSMPPIHAIEEWLLNNSYKYKVSGYCFGKGEDPILQVKQGNGKWKSTRAVPSLIKTDSCPLKKYPLRVSFRLKPKDLGIKIPAGERRVQVRVRVKDSGGKTEAEKVNVFGSQQDYKKFWQEANDQILELMLDRLGLGTKKNCSYKGTPLYGKVYFTDSEYRADVTVYFTAYEYSADLNVYFSNYRPGTSCGEWYRTTNEYSADFTVYETDYEYSADLKVYETDYSSSAGFN